LFWRRHSFCLYFSGSEVARIVEYNPLFFAVFRTIILQEESNEKNISTEFDKTKEQTRFSRTDEIKRWTKSACTQESQRSLEINSQRRTLITQLTNEYPGVDKRLKKKEILRGKNSFRHIISKGVPIGGTTIRCTVAPLQPTMNTKRVHYVIGITVRRSVKCAVNRNRFKRWVRESYRLHKSLLEKRERSPNGPIGIIFTCSQYPPPAHTPSFKIVEKDIKSMLKQISVLQL